MESKQVKELKSQIVELKGALNNFVCGHRSSVDIIFNQNKEIKKLTRENNKLKETNEIGYKAKYEKLLAKMNKMKKLFEEEEEEDDD
jgi:hypothetical protein